MMLKVIAESDQIITIQAGAGYATLKLEGDDIHVKYSRFEHGEFDIYAYDKLEGKALAFHDQIGWNMTALEKLVIKPLAISEPLPCLSLKMREMHFEGEDDVFYITAARVKVFPNSVSVDWRFSRNDHVEMRGKFFNFRHDPGYATLCVEGTWDFDKLKEVMMRYGEAPREFVHIVTPNPT